MGIVFSIVSFMVLISILVAVHEWGHLMIARANGVFVESFSIGYGPVLLEKKDKYGTKWRFSLLPIGGYVKMLGDADATSVREMIPEGVSDEQMEKMSIHRKKPWQKLLVAAGGPFANFIFAIFILISVGIIQGIPTYTNEIKLVAEHSVAYQAGLRDGDQIIKANGQDIKNFNQIREAIVSSVGKDLDLGVMRNNKIENIKIKMYNEQGQPISTIGITPVGVEYQKANITKVLSNACLTTYTIAAENIKGIFKMVVSEKSTKNIGGVISIFNMASQSAEAGLMSFIWMTAFLSIILGAINLLPIPVLDGGTIMISAIEWIIGKPLNSKVINIIFFIGLMIVAGLMLIGIWNDLDRCNFLNKIIGFFSHR